MNSPPSLGDPEKEEEIGIIQTRSDFLLELAEQSSGPLTACPSLQQLGPLLPPTQTQRFPVRHGLKAAGEIQPSLFPLEFLSQISGCRDAGWSSHRPESHGISEVFTELEPRDASTPRGPKDIPTKQMNQYPGL